MTQEVIKIRGGQTLSGTVHNHGAKNSAVAIIPATLLAEDKVTVEGLPQISDVDTLVSLLGDLNIHTELEGTTLDVIRQKLRMHHYRTIKYNLYVHLII